MSERADILVLEVSNDGLSFETIKSKIKNLAPAGLVGALADPLLTTIIVLSTILVVCTSSPILIFFLCIMLQINATEIPEIVTGLFLLKQIIA